MLVIRRRTLALLATIVTLAGCIHIPRAVRTELECSSTGASHFGVDESCELPPAH